MVWIRVQLSIVDGFPTPWAPRHSAEWRSLPFRPERVSVVVEQRSFRPWIGAASDDLTLAVHHRYHALLRRIQLLALHRRMQPG